MIESGRLHPRVELLPRRVARAGVALAGGLAAAAALPPDGMLPGLLGLTALTFLVHRADSRREAFLMGLSFGIGWFGLGLNWVTIAFAADPERVGGIAVPAVAALTIACALFSGLAALLARLVRWRSPLATGLALASAWTLTEQLRGSWGLRFPWNPVSLAWSGDSPALQGVAWLGSPGLTFLTVAAFGLMSGFLSARGRGRWRGPILGGLILVALHLGGALRLHGLHPGATGIELRLVQGAVPQDLKWDPARREGWFMRYVELSARPRAVPATVTIWPESAVPYAIDRDATVRDFLGRAAGAGGWLVTGGNRYVQTPDGDAATNSLWVVDAAGAVAERYDKVDLVAFGEFLPFRPLLAAIGLRKLALGSFDFVPGPGRRTLSLPGLPPFSPLICYEAIYAGEAVAAGEPRPSWLLNITNDAWFGFSAGPYQHLAMARMRAIETGLPLVRAANTGISTVLDPLGRTVARLELGPMGVLDATLPAALPAPPLYARLGDAIVAAAIGLGVLLATLAERQARRRTA